MVNKYKFLLLWLIFLFDKYACTNGKVSKKFLE